MKGRCRGKTRRSRKVGPFVIRERCKALPSVFDGINHCHYHLTPRERAIVMRLDERIRYKKVGVDKVDPG